MMKTARVLFLVVAIVTVMVEYPFCADTDTSSQQAEKAPQGRDAPWHPEQAAETAKPPIIRKLSEGVFQVGDVTVNKPLGLVRLAGEINMDQGLVEYLACGPLGKLHESVLVLHAQPYHLQVALLLLGLEPGDKPLSHQGAEETPQGDPVEIRVSWKTPDTKTMDERAEALIQDHRTQKPMQRTDWVYTGSQIIDGKFMAQLEQSIVATYHDPYAMFDHPLSTGTDDTLYYVNQQLVPPKGTPVTMTIKPIPIK
jgi:hypothetical protein